MIRDEEFYDAIIDKESVNDALNSYSDENNIPYLSIDDLLKKNIRR